MRYGMHSDRLGFQLSSSYLVLTNSHIFFVSHAIVIRICNKSLVYHYFSYLFMGK